MRGVQADEGEREREGRERERRGEEKETITAAFSKIKKTRSLSLSTPLSSLAQDGHRTRGRNKPSGKKASTALQALRVRGE